MTRDSGESGEPSLYFAYGSNLSTARMRERVASARVLCSARAAGFALSLAKAGRDGSGKATLVPAADAVVWGVVYAIDPEAWPVLDGFEGGYSRSAIVVARDGASALSGERAGPLTATTYIAPETAPDPTPFAWYKRLIVEGAREHGFPADYIAQLEALPSRGDA